MNYNAEVIPIREYKQDNPYSDVVFAIECDSDNEERHTISLVEGGKNAYLWIGQDGRYVTTVSGVKALRALTNAILKEIGPTKPKRKK